MIVYVNLCTQICKSSIFFCFKNQSHTTGGLLTFIDVGNSFGALAIVEDNLLHQFHSLAFLS
ncbi:hypothetical protein RchiOBHm_Chr5g0052551 [Rosa chinensis]|uniref:Uncharacterized protein n=1 Tax=Rosa chinensis TaxID=74649 RepID=A0A2P6QFM9_ROSCH|nr:hypothetical protein RchiOBHm_Chr5g0052551 [Rosa chinensis]